MAAPPLTHHDILRLVEPFSRSGRQLDLAASDRAARRLVFKPAAACATAAQPVGLRESLVLEDLGTGTFLLTRTFTSPDGLQATAQAMGPEPRALHDALLAMPPERQFSVGPGFEIARSYRLQWRGPSGEATPAWTLASGVVQLSGLSLTMTVSGVKGVSAEIVLTPTPSNHAKGPLALPQDLLAVLGWNWARLIPGRSQGTPALGIASWKTRLRLPGPAVGRTARAEAGLAEAAAHLAITLAEPPERFHERHVSARWAVFFRRGIPLLNVALMLMALWLLPHFDVGESPGLGLLLYHLPTLLIAGSFWLQEFAAFEIPPWPRRLRASSWKA